MSGILVFLLIFGATAAGNEFQLLIVKFNALFFGKGKDFFRALAICSSVKPSNSSFFMVESSNWLYGITGVATQVQHQEKNGFVVKAKLSSCFSSIRFFTNLDQVIL